MKRYLLLLVMATFCLISTDVRAASLFGKVIEVNSGDVITIFNLNRPVRVKLLGVDAPKMNQAFGDVAKKHLADLVLDQSVLVEYSGIAADSSLTGRVLLNNSDIGAQMIRDGAAWFDTNTNRLSGTERDVYQQSEQAARNERRGLWQEENPIAPWDFVRNEALRRNPVASLKSTTPGATPASKPPVSELTNFTLMTAGIEAAQPRLLSAANSDMVIAAPGPTGGAWRLLRPAGANFSALVPAGGKQTDVPVPEGESHIFLARDGSSVYTIAWVTAPSMGETDEDAIAGSLSVFTLGVGQGFRIASESAGRPQSFQCELENEKKISQSGYTGSDYDLNSCTVPARARALTRVVDGQRQMYIAMVFYTQEDENVDRFINSFTIGAPKSKSRTR
jgi:endonuclease YncB( thermonuclease family)